MLQSSELVKQVLTSKDNTKPWVGVLLADSEDLKDQIYAVEADSKDSLLLSLSDCLFHLAVVDPLGRSVYFPRSGINVRYPDGSLEIPISSETTTTIMSAMMGRHNCRGLNARIVNGQQMVQVAADVANGVVADVVDRVTHKPGIGCLNAAMANHIAQVALSRINKTAPYTAVVLFEKVGIGFKPFLMGADDEERLQRMIVSAILLESRVDLDTGEIQGDFPNVLMYNANVNVHEQMPPENVCKLIRQIGKSVKANPIPIEEFLSPGDFTTGGYGTDDDGDSI